MFCDICGVEIFWPDEPNITELDEGVVFTLCQDCSLLDSEYLEDDDYYD